MPFTQKILRSRSLALQTLSLSPLTLFHLLSVSISLCVIIYVIHSRYVFHSMYVFYSMQVIYFTQVIHFAQVIHSIFVFRLLCSTFPIHLCIFQFTLVSFYSLVCLSIHLCVILFTCVSFYSLVCLSIHLCVFLFIYVRFIFIQTCRSHFENIQFAVERENARTFESKTFSWLETIFDEQVCNNNTAVPT